MGVRMAVRMGAWMGAWKGHIVEVKEGPGLTGESWMQLMHSCNHLVCR